jgi:hypothetical protein
VAETGCCFAFTLRVLGFLGVPSMDKEEYLIFEYKRGSDPEKFKRGLDLRLEVFVNEQKFAFETEEDDKEYISDHFSLAETGLHQPNPRYCFLIYI